jgi:hypothetical protein
MNAYARHRDISDWIYQHKGKLCRNLNGKVEMNNVEVTRQDILNLYRELKEKYEGIVLSRIEDCLAPSYFDYRYGKYEPFAKEGWLAGKKYTLAYLHDDSIHSIYKAHGPRNEFVVRVVKGPLVMMNQFFYKSEAINYLNSLTQAEITANQFYL